MSRDIQCSCTSLLSVYWTCLKSASIWDSFDLDWLLQIGDLLPKSFASYRCRYLGIEDLPLEFFIEDSSVNVDFLNNRTTEITAGAYLVSITEIVSDCQHISTGALLIINNYIFGLLLGKLVILVILVIFDSIAKMKLEGCQAQVRWFC